MAFTPSDFADDTDFERLVLERLGTHRVRPAEPGAIFDVRGKETGHNVEIQLGAIVRGTQAREELRQSLQPLGFGAAYKVLDMLVEHVLRDNGASGRLRFDQKEAKLKERPKRLPRPFDTRPELWDRLVALYVALVESRHAVTHRRAPAVGGNLEIYDNDRRHTDTVTTAEITSFAAAVHAVAELVIDATDDARRVDIVAWHLDALQPRHGLPVLGATNPDAGRRLLKLDLVDLGDGELRFDVARASGVIKSQTTPSLWDLRLYGDGSVFVGAWENVPDPDASVLDFRPETLPEWLSEEVPGG